MNRIQHILLVFWAAMGILALLLSVSGLIILLFSLLLGMGLGLFILAGLLSISLLSLWVALIIGLIKKRYMAWPFAVMGQSWLFFLLGLVFIIQFFIIPFSLGGFVTLGIVALLVYIAAVARACWLSESFRQAYSLDKWCNQTYSVKSNG